MRYLLPILLILFAGCARETTEQRTTTGRAAGIVAGQAFDVSFDLGSEAESRTVTTVDEETLRRFAGPLVDAVLARLGISPGGSTGSLPWGDIAQGGTLGLLAALTGNQVLAERRKKRRDQANGHTLKPPDPET